MTVFAVVLVPLLLMFFAFTMERIEASLLKAPELPETLTEVPAFPHSAAA
ncbi:hypothetical protein [Corynebacterium pacaense]|nr:hypothetical protein [Corynebacterium pacaense]